MNIFYVDEDPELAARALCDKHVVKMPLETAQIACTVLAKLGVTGAPYKPTHRHHPCVRWAGQSSGNYTWLLLHGLFLCDEYTRRYGREHASEQVLRWCDKAPWDDLLLKPELMLPALCMPEEFRQLDHVAAYRAFYVARKRRFATWKPPSSPPSWWPQ